MLEFASIAESISIILACCALIAGIGAWKREFIGKRKIELAEETLSIFFEVQDAISYIRNPFSSSSEGSSRKKESHESPEEAQLLDRGYIVFERYEQRRDAFMRFNTVKYRFMAVFGKETEDIFSRTNKTLNSIFSAANILSRHYWQRQGRTEMTKDEFQKHLEEMKKFEMIFWDHYDDNDEVKSELAAVQARLDAVTRPCFEEPMKSFSILTKKWL